MRTTLRKLQILMVVLLLLLAGGVAAFVVYGRHLAHRWAVALPKRLARELLQESFNVSFSHSEHGHTVFTVHAAKEQKWTSGLITLDDVGIELYGRQEGAPDRIHGSKFEFDQAKGILRAVGEVFIDLPAPVGKDGRADESRTFHVRTDGLVFDQKARTAATDAGIEFQAGGLTGTAVGADYDSVQQHIVLRSEVRVSGIRDDRPVVLTAAHAELDRRANVADLRAARYVSPGRSVAADAARVLLTAAGEAREVEAEGHVVLRGQAQGTLGGDRLQMALGEGGRAQDGHLWGHVVYADRAAGREVQGTAADLRVAFLGTGAPERAVMTGGVALESRTGATGRSVRADRVELTLADAGQGRVAVRQAMAAGGAVLRSAGTGTRGKTSSEVRGDVLQAEFSGAGASARVTHLDGTGHTLVDQVAADGAEDRSTGDALQVEFAGAGKQLEIAHAVQRGNFQTVRTVPARAGAKGAAVGPTTQRGQATEAVYDGPANRLRLTGQVQLSEAGDLLQADTVLVDRATGDAEATGNVRTSYTQPAGPSGKPGDPVHMVAARAVERKAAGQADFFGAGPVDARMWQGGSQVSAPELSFDRAKGTLVAHGSGAGDADVVRTVLVGTADGKAAGQPGSGGPVRVLSHSMVYTDGSREVVFAGRVRVEGRDGVLTAREATAYLAPAGAARAASGAAPVAGFPAGQVERIVARGGVEIAQTDRRAHGEELVYTAADRLFVLTGTPGARPSVTDDAQGTITGNALRFHTGDGSIQVIGGDSDAGRVRSDLRVKQP